MPAGAASAAGADVTVTLDRLYRHPVKSLGEEAVAAVTLEAGRHMPWDRVWALTHAATGFDPARAEWRSGKDFVIQSLVPELAQLRAAFDEVTETLTLSHPDRPDLAVRPGGEGADTALGPWLAPLVGARLDGPFRLVRLPGQPLTDFPETHLLICSNASRAELETMAGKPLADIRFRANVWLDGLDPWAEFDLIGREIGIGAARVRILRPCSRCNATTASPETGERDVPVPGLLRRRFGHMDFGVYAEVTGGGRIAPGDEVRL